MAYSRYSIVADGPFEISCTLAAGFAAGDVAQEIYIDLGHAGEYPEPGEVLIGSAILAYDEVDERPDGGAVAILHLSSPHTFAEDVAEGASVTVRTTRRKISETVQWTLTPAAGRTRRPTRMARRLSWTEGPYFCGAEHAHMLRGRPHFPQQHGIRDGDERHVVVSPVAFRVGSISRFGEDAKTGRATPAAVRLHAVLGRGADGDGAPFRQEPCDGRVQGHCARGRRWREAHRVKLCRLLLSWVGIIRRRCRDGRGLRLVRSVIPSMSAATLGARRPATCSAWQAEGGMGPHEV